MTGWLEAGDISDAWVDHLGALRVQCPSSPTAPRGGRLMIPIAEAQGPVTAVTVATRALPAGYSLINGVLTTPD